MLQAIKTHIKPMIVGVLLVMVCLSLTACSGGNYSENNDPNSTSDRPITLHGNDQTVSVITSTYFQNMGGVHSMDKSNQKLDHYLNRVTNINDYTVHIYSLTLHHDFFHKIVYNITFIRKGSHHEPTEESYEE